MPDVSEIAVADSLRLVTVGRHVPTSAFALPVATRPSSRPSRSLPNVSPQLKALINMCFNTDLALIVQIRTVLRDCARRSGELDDTKRQRHSAFSFGEEAEVRFGPCPALRYPNRS